MDKDLDYEIYRDLDGQFLGEGDLLPQKKILLTRALKLSAVKSKYSSAEIGRVLLRSGQLQKSLIQLKRATIIDPDNDVVHINLARVFLKLEKENEAFSELKKALCLDPGYYRPHHLVINTLLEQERLGDIESFYQEIANMLTKTKSITDLYYGGARALIGYNKYSKALEMFKKSFETHQMNSRYHFQYAIALYHEGEFEEAIVQFEHVKRLEPTNNLALSNLAHLQYCAGKLQKAFEEFEEIIANGLVSSETYSNFILVLFHMGKDEDVINQYRDLLQQNLGGNGSMLQSMYEEALKITRAVLERDDIDEGTREFNIKKIQALNLVLSFLK